MRTHDGERGHGHGKARHLIVNGIFDRVQRLVAIGAIRRKGVVVNIRTGASAADQEIRSIVDAIKNDDPIRPRSIGSAHDTCAVIHPNRSPTMASSGSRPPSGEIETHRIPRPSRGPGILDVNGQVACWIGGRIDPVLGLRLAITTVTHHVLWLGYTRRGLDCLCRALAQRSSR